MGGESDNPRRNIPLAVVGSILITAVIYVLLQIAYIAAVRPADLARSHGWATLSFTNDAGPLAAIASLIGLAWLSTILLIDAVVSPADTGLIYTDGHRAVVVRDGPKRQRAAQPRRHEPSRRALARACSSPSSSG